MSMEALAWAMKRPVKSLATKAVLFILADKANGEGKCWPSIAELKKITGVSERMVRYHITALADAGYVSAEQQGRAANVYTLALTGNVLPAVESSTGNILPVEHGNILPCVEIADRQDISQVSEGSTGNLFHSDRQDISATSLLTQKNPKEKLPRTRGHAHTREGPKAPAKHPEVAAMAKAYETLSLSINPRIGELMVEWCKEHPKTPVEWFAQAADEALKANVRSWNYFVKVLDSWSAQGFAGRRDARADRPGYGRIPRTPGDLSFAANA